MAGTATNISLATAVCLLVTQWGLDGVGGGGVVVASERGSLIAIVIISVIITMIMLL